MKNKKEQRTNNNVPAGDVDAPNPLAVTSRTKRTKNNVPTSDVHAPKPGGRDEKNNGEIPVFKENCQRSQ